MRNLQNWSCTRISTSKRLRSKKSQCSGYSAGQQNDLSVQSKKKCYNTANSTLKQEGERLANIVIVGANQGIGYYLTKRLLELNHSVAVLDIDVSAIEELQSIYPQTVFPIVADARSLESIQNGVEKAFERFKGIDVAIHNACLCTFESEQNTDYDVYQKVMDVNFFGALRTPNKT